MKSRWSQKGFTIVELLIVIVVIAILAAITMVAYNGIQQRARDAQRKSDITALVKALEIYYINNGSYPLSSGSTSINSSWSTTADSSWQNLVNQLTPYISSVPKDPISKQTSAGAYPWNDAGGYDYSYYSRPGYCVNATTAQAFLLVYKYEVTSQANTLEGSCSYNAGSLYAGSNYRRSKD
ncbi:Type II secretion system protein G [Candidatus Saccharibacteria bacterium RAAC3_TM7_1]|nr:Type II secretion system protein G [Candidatus Saccharibacteria bacterium RAAC3_TM7_1]HCZ28798.1 prepilin-type N-terminal cleavage/methylation domain-containing protein [Candidatus Saccharibacteria bacterium]